MPVGFAASFHYNTCRSIDVRGFGARALGRFAWRTAGSSRAVPSRASAAANSLDGHASLVPHTPSDAFDSLADQPYCSSGDIRGERRPPRTRPTASIALQPSRARMLSPFATRTRLGMPPFGCGTRPQSWPNKPPIHADAFHDSFGYARESSEIRAENRG